MEASDALRLAQATTAKFKRLLALKTAFHSTLTRSAQEDELFLGVCRQLVHVGGYRRAWVVLTTDSGHDAVPHLGCDAAGSSTRDPAWAADTLHPDALRLPLVREGRQLGSLVLRASRADDFDPDERSVLEQLAIDLAYAVVALRVAAENQRMAQQLRNLSRTVEQSPVSVVMTDLEGRIEYVNSAFTRITGYTFAEAHGRDPSFLKSGQTPPEVYAELWNTISAGNEWRGEILNRRKSGELFWERQLITPLKNEAGQATHYLAVKEDISALKQADAELRLRERVVESSSNGIMITAADEPDHPIIYVNPAFERMTGYRADEVLGKNGRFLVRGDLDQVGLVEIRAALRERREGQAIIRTYRKDGSRFWNELRVAPVRDEQGRSTTHFISIVNDITDLMRYQEQLEHQATHDVLTGLANRSLLGDRITQAIAHARRENHMVGVLLLDLDRFKLVNDGFGHPVGDTLLRQVAGRLSTCVRDTDTVARLGGDEFVIVVSGAGHVEDVAQVAAKIVATLAAPFHLEDKEIFVTASIGISLFPRDGDQGETLLRDADIAMYRMKEHGRASYRFYTPEMNTMALSRLDMEGALRHALERGEFRLYYQPKVEVATGKVTGVEALIRWAHPQVGLVMPEEFIPLAEETGLIIPIGEWVLRTACADLRTWLAAAPSVVVPVAVNLSARQFRQDNLAGIVRGIIERAGVPGRLLELELTESMVMHQADNSALVLRELKALGLALSLDDFGTGYSSLSYLKRFPIDALKIDRSFVRDITVDADDAAIARAVIAMAHSLGLTVVAEGVEADDQLRLLRDNGCDTFQGNLFSRPLPAGELIPLLSPQADR